MAARKKSDGARKTPARDYDSVLLRSAESLGRMIGALQRQLDTVSKRLGTSDGDGHHGDGDGDGAGKLHSGGTVKPTSKKRKKAAAAPKSSAGARKHGAAKSARKSVRPR